MTKILPLACGLALMTAVAAGPAGAEDHPAPPPFTLAPAPAGAYTLDKAHASLVFRINHLGFSNYTGRFAQFDASLQFDPAAPAAAEVTATVEARSLELENPPAGFVASLLGGQWLDAGQFPAISFRSTKVERTGSNTALVTGDFTLHGVTAPITLEATFNGGYAGHPMEPRARIGFSARGTLRRSVYGISAGIPAPGTTMGVGDLVEVAVEAEFTGPPLAAPPAAQ